MRPAAGCVAGQPPAAVGLPDAFGDAGQCLPDVAHHRYVGMDDLVDLRRVDLQVDHAGVAAEVFRVARHTVVEAHPGGDQQVALLIADVRTVVAVHAQHADVAGIVARQCRQSEQRRGRRDAALLHECLQLFFGSAQQHALSDEQHRALRFVDQPCGFGDALPVGLGGRDVAADRLHAAVAERSRGALRILRDVHDHRTGTARPGDVEGPGDGFGNLPGPLDLAVPFGHRLRDAHEVGLLEGVGPELCRTDLTGDEHQRRGVHQRVGQPGNGVRGSRPGGHQADPYATACAGITLGGVYGPLLVAHEDVAQSVAVVAERVVDRDDRAAGVAEQCIDPFAEERFEQGLRSREMRCVVAPGRSVFGMSCRIHRLGMGSFNGFRRRAAVRRPGRPS